MKNFKTYLFIGLLLFTFKTNAQYIVMNEDLLKIVTENAGMRVISANIFKNNYKEQANLSSENKTKIAEVFAIHEKLYQEIFNINEFFKNAQQIKYIQEEFKYTVNALGELSRIALKKPQYAIWFSKGFLIVMDDISKLKEIVATITKKNRQILMDYYDRHKILENVFNQIRLTRVDILGLISLIKMSMNEAYIYVIPELGDWVRKDKEIIKDIQFKYKYFKYL